MKTCKHCHQKIGSGPHHCPRTNEIYEEDDNSFITGIVTGMIIDELLSGSDNSSSDSSFDSSSSSDSPDFGGGDFGGGGGGGDW